MPKAARGGSKRQGNGQGGSGHGGYRQVVRGGDGPG